MQTAQTRNEGAAAYGSKPKAGLAGFTVSNLLNPGFEQPWETDFGWPAHIASALDIMLEGPLGSSAFVGVLRLPFVGSKLKSFLITIGDRTITGLVTWDRMVEPWQVPVADVTVTRSSYGFDMLTSEAMAMGELTPVAILDAAASAHMAVVESLTNLAAANVGDLRHVKLSANWMCATSKEGEGAALYNAVKAVGLELCSSLGVGIPICEDVMSMLMRWQEGVEKCEVSVVLIIMAIRG